MISTIALAVALAVRASTPVEDASAYSQAYEMAVSVDRGGCVYWLTDVGLSAAQMEVALRHGYQPSRGLEVLTSPGATRCVDRALKTASKLGFHPVRARPSTERDRLVLP